MSVEPVEAFLDTNVPLYSVSELPADAAKRAIARDLMRYLEFGVSAQVCQEFYVVATGKLKHSVTPGTATEFVRKLMNRPFVPTDVELIQAAIELRQRFQVSYWDAAIIAAAQRLGAKTIYSEDLSHGQHYGSVQVVNPFLVAKVS